jgi:CheY-like chemotaxis protein
MRIQEMLKHPMIGLSSCWNFFMKTILIVDDEKHILKVLEYSLAESGCIIETASNGEDAIRKAGSQTIDLLLIDYQMPGMNGFETVHELKNNEKYAELPVIMLTGRGQSEIRAGAATAGVSLFLNKPFSPTELLRHVKRLMPL